MHNKSVGSIEISKERKLKKKRAKNLGKKEKVCVCGGGIALCWCELWVLVFACGIISSSLAALVGLVCHIVTLSVTIRKI